MAKLSDELNRTLAEAGEGLKALQDEVICTFRSQVLRNASG
jgi:hypothetical protein